VTDDQADPGNRPRQADTEAHQLDSSGASLSILFGEPALAIREGAVAVQPYFADLNLDQVVEAVTRGREEYDLKPFFNTPLRTMDAVAYRHEVLRDLADEALRSCMASFAEGMRDVRQHLAQVGELRHRHQKKAWFLDAAKVYCEAVGQLAEDLAQIELESRALRSFRDYLARYVQSSRFTTLRSESAEVGVALGDVRY
jgi:DNA mismatch repair protein MutS